MVTCWRRKAKSSLGRAADDDEGGLTGAGAAFTLEGAVVTTCFTGTRSLLWPTAFSLFVLAPEGIVAGGASLTVGVCSASVAGVWLARVSSSWIQG